MSSTFVEAAPYIPDHTPYESSADLAVMPNEIPGTQDAVTAAPAGIGGEVAPDTWEAAEPWQSEQGTAAVEPAATTLASAVVEDAAPASLQDTPAVLDAGDLPVPVEPEPALKPRRSRSRSKAATSSATGSDEEGALPTGKATTAGRPGRSRARQRRAVQDAVVGPEPAIVLPEDALPAPVDLEAAVAPQESPARETPGPGAEVMAGGQTPYEDTTMLPVDLEAVVARPEAGTEAASPANHQITAVETPTHRAPARVARDRRSRVPGKQGATRQATNLEAWAWETESQADTQDTIPVAGPAQQPAATDSMSVAGSETQIPAIATAPGSADQPADEVDPIAWIGKLIDLVGDPDATAEGAAEPLPGADTFRDWYDEIDLTPSTPGGDLESTEALTRALLELFPPETTAETEAEEAEEGLEDLDGEDLQDALSDDLEQDESDEALAADGSAEESAESGRRRGRRGRRGGRGRKRGAAGLQDEVKSDAGGPEAQNGASGTGGVSEAPVRLEPAGDVFSPDGGQRQEKPWRERGARRRWGKPFGIVNRDLAPVTMPPPKPSNGARFAPIPQAVQPRPFVAPMPDVAALAPASQVALPRLDEPLVPGESRTERLLETQTRLLQMMIEQQARQIELLTASVANLHKAMEGMVNTGVTAGVTTYQPRTAIFVDAPNVCYAAENARVNLDFGRMLKYLSRDRQLVHALSYSPIIDDVREGIRYETQRFVAPFLRTGYKLVTKPLKRFSDGSAKGNFDIELALDILTMADRLDIVVLVSGDSDFESVIEHIQSRGVRVEIVAFASNVSTELVNVADAFIDINLHLEHFKVL
jgi:uncharacterized LabA/DUF88 family protein